MRHPLLVTVVVIATCVSHLTPRLIAINEALRKASMPPRDFERVANGLRREATVTARGRVP